MQIMLLRTQFRLYWVPVFNCYGDVRPSVVHLWITMDIYGMRHELLIAEVYDDVVSTGTRVREDSSATGDEWYALTIYEPVRLAPELVIVTSLTSAKQVLLTRVLTMLQSEFIMAAVWARAYVKFGRLPENLEWCVNADAY